MKVKVCSKYLVIGTGEGLKMILKQKYVLFQGYFNEFN